MQHLKITIDFSGIVPKESLEQVSSDPLWLVRDESMIPDLKQWVATYYLSEKLINPKIYDEMVFAAISNENLLGLETLWQGIYWYGQDRPDYHRCVVFAKRGSLKTFQHVLYAYFNYADFEEKEPLDWVDLSDFSSLTKKGVQIDPQVVQFIKMLGNFSNSEGKLVPRYFVEKEFDQDTHQFYLAISQFQPISVAQQ